MPKKKKRTIKKRKDTKKKRRKTTDPYKKYDRGGRVEAYTMGEAMGKGSWP